MVGGAVYGGQGYVLGRRALGGGRAPSPRSGGTWLRFRGRHDAKGRRPATTLDGEWGVVRRARTWASPASTGPSSQGPSPGARNRARARAETLPCCLDPYRRARSMPRVAPLKPVLGGGLALRVHARGRAGGAGARPPRAGADSRGADRPPPPPPRGRGGRTVRLRSTQITLLVVFGLALSLAGVPYFLGTPGKGLRSEEHTSELQSLRHLVCRLL